MIVFLVAASANQYFGVFQHLLHIIGIVYGCVDIDLAFGKGAFEHQDRFPVPSPGFELLHHAVFVQ
jgi:hypothetical protein